MTFTVLLHPRVERFIDKLEKIIAERISNKLRLLEENPFHILRHHQGADVFKLRIGDYRALVDVDTKNQVVYIRHLDHRKRVYKK